MVRILLKQCGRDIKEHRYLKGMFELQNVEDPACALSAFPDNAGSQSCQSQGSVWEAGGDPESQS